MSLSPGATEPLATEAVEPLVSSLLVTDAAPAPMRILGVVWEFVHDMSVAVLFCFFLVTFVGQAFRVEGTSMLPLLESGDRILVDKLAYRFGPVARGDVVVFWSPLDPDVSFIKRVIGLPGDDVEVRKGVVIVNGTPLAEGYVPARFRGDESSHRVTVSPGHYYVLGDHRNSSNDSRSWGEVPRKYIYGRAAFRIWPLDRMSGIR